MSDTKIEYPDVPTYIAHVNSKGELVNTPTPAEETAGTDSYAGEHLKHQTDDNS